MILLWYNVSRLNTSAIILSSFLSNAPAEVLGTCMWDMKLLLLGKS